MRRATVLVALALRMGGTPGAAVHAQPLEGPVVPVGGEGRVRWPAAAPAPEAGGPTGRRLRAARGPADSLAAWATAAGDSLLRPYALRRMADLHLALGDTTRAETLWAALAGERSPWQWEAVRARADLAGARGDLARADSLLEAADRREWPDAERGEWLARRVALRRSLGDTAVAVALAGQMLGRYPAAAGALQSLETLEELRAARGEPLAREETGRAAEAEWLNGRRAAAAARLVRAASGPPGALEARGRIRLARMLRELRRFREARAAAAAALSVSRSPEDSIAALMEEARTLRDQGEIERALRAYRALGARHEALEAFWERARLLEGRGAWRAARDDYERVAAGGTARREEAVLRAGLMSLAAGEETAASERLASGGSEGARFWRAVVLRRTRRAAGDSLLRELAALPGYSFYRSAARETLGVRGWPDAAVAWVGVPAEPGVTLARALDRLGCHEDAARVLDRWAEGDGRLAARERSAGGPEAGAWLAAAAAAYAAGRSRQAIRLAGSAARAQANAPQGGSWSVTPWLYPPAFDSLFAAYPESAAAGGLDRPLLQALAWKESGLDPVARSRSDARGLLQLKRATAAEVARWLGEPPPSDSALADPALSLRFGARYLERQLERFSGDLPLALAAYNAGPSVARRWIRLRAIGGPAVTCEEIDWPETQDYVKTVLAVRQAYRELRPGAPRGR